VQYKFPLPLLLALAVAVGVTITIVVQVTILSPPPAIVAPIETMPESVDASRTYTISIEVAQGEYIIYPTLIGLGKLRLESNVSGWYYLQNDWVVSLVRRETGDAVFMLPNNNRVYVKEINDTHAFIFYTQHYTGIVAKKVQVGSTGWIIYHPVVTDYDSNTLEAIRALLQSIGYTYTYVFQPRRDYITFVQNQKYFYVYFDRVTNTGYIYRREYYLRNSTNFVSIHANTPVEVVALVRMDANTYVLQSIWGLLYYLPDNNVRIAFSVTPVR
jgi:hypothetical protein